MAKKRICVIGAGPSGLAQLRAFQSAKPNRAQRFPRSSAYEKQSDWGGLWNYTWRTGVDDNGEPCHGSMYRYLWSNGPKEGLEFADYSFEEHFGKQIASYPPREVLFDYIKGRVEKADVRDWIRFDTFVRDVRYDPGARNFTVTVVHLPKDVDTSRNSTTSSSPRAISRRRTCPIIPALTTLTGRILHAHDFRDAREFQDKDILIIGTSYSAEDIG